MKTNTFEHHESLARSKGIVCERRSARKIELTTPCGGTTAECATVAEALDTLRTDPTFSDLPIKCQKPSAAPVEVVAPLDALARELVGDGQSSNLFFVTKHGIVQTVSSEFGVAYEAYYTLRRQLPRIECALEDRQNGTLASFGPDDDNTPGRWIESDDTRAFGFRN
jgi:hypothetical protein